MITSKNKWINGALPALLIHISIGSIYAFSTFTQPLIEEMGITLQQAQLAFSIAIFFLGMSACCFSKWIERDISRSTSVCMGLFILGMLLTSYAINIKSLMLLYVGYGVVFGIACGIGYITPVKNLMEWFKDSKGFATGMAVMAFGLSSTITSPLAIFLIGKFGLSTTFAIIGFMYGLLIIAANALIKKPDNIYYEKYNSISYKEVLSDKKFWNIWFIIYINILCGLTLISLASPILTSNNFSVAAAATVVGVMGIFNAAGRIVVSSVSDKLLNRKNVYVFLSIVSAMVIFSSIVDQGNELVIMLFIVAACYGAGFSTLPAMLSDIYGNKNVTTYHGCVLSAWAIAGLSSNILTRLYTSNGLIILLSIICLLYIIEYVFVEALKKDKTIEFNTMEDYVNYYVKTGYIHDDFEPIKCMKCDCKDFTHNTIDTHDGWFETEYELVCNKCGERVGLWAYGYWQL